MKPTKRSHDGSSSSDSEDGKRRATGERVISTDPILRETPILRTREVIYREAYLRKYPRLDADAPYGNKTNADDPNLPQFNSFMVYQNISVCSDSTKRPWWPACKNSGDDTRDQCAMAEVVAYLGGTLRDGVAVMTTTQIEDEGESGYLSEFCYLCCLRTANNDVAHSCDPVPWANPIPTVVLRTHTPFRVIREMPGGYLTSALLSAALLPTRRFRYTDYAIIAGGTAGSGLVECVDVFYRVGPSAVVTPSLASPDRKYGIPAIPRVGTDFVAAAAPAMPNATSFNMPTDPSVVKRLLAHPTTIDAILYGRNVGRGWCRKPLVSLPANNAKRDSQPKRSDPSNPNTTGDANVPPPTISPHMSGIGNIVPPPIDRRTAKFAPQAVHMAEDSAPNGLGRAYALIEFLAAPADDFLSVATIDEIRSGDWINRCHVAAGVVLQYISAMVGIRSGVLNTGTSPRSIDVMEYVNVRGALVDDMHSVVVANRSRACLETATFSPEMWYHIREWFDPVAPISLFDQSSDSRLVPVLVEVDRGVYDYASARIAIIESIGDIMDTMKLIQLQPLCEIIEHLRGMPLPVVRAMFGDRQLGFCQYYNPLVAPGVTVSSFLYTVLKEGVEEEYYTLAAVVLHTNIIHYVMRVARAGIDSACIRGKTDPLPSAAYTTTQMSPAPKKRQRTLSRNIKAMTKAEHAAHKSKMRSLRVVRMKEEKLRSRKVRGDDRASIFPSATVVSNEGTHACENVSVSPSELASTIVAKINPDSLIGLFTKLVVCCETLQSAIIPLDVAFFGLQDSGRDRRSMLHDGQVASRYGIASVFYPWEHAARNVGHMDDHMQHAIAIGLPTSVVRAKPTPSVVKDKCTLAGFLDGRQVSRLSAREMRNRTRSITDRHPEDTNIVINGTRDPVYWRCSINAVYASLTGAYANSGSARTILSADVACTLYMTLVCGWIDPVPLLDPSIVLHAWRDYVLYNATISPAAMSCVRASIVPTSNHHLFSVSDRARASMQTTQDQITVAVETYTKMHNFTMETMRMAMCIGRDMECIAQWASRVVRASPADSPVQQYNNPQIFTLISAVTKVDGERKKGGYYNTSKHPPPTPLRALATARVLTEEEKKTNVWTRPAMRPAADFARMSAIVDVSPDVAKKDADLDVDAEIDLERFANMNFADDISSDSDAEVDRDPYGLMARAAADAKLRPTWSRTRKEEDDIAEYMQVIPVGCIPTPVAAKILGLQEETDLTIYTELYALFTRNGVPVTSSAQCKSFKDLLFGMTAHGYSIVRLMCKMAKRVAAYDVVRFHAGDIARVYERSVAVMVRDGFPAASPYDSATLADYMGVLDSRHSRVPETLPAHSQGVQMNKGQCLTDMFYTRPDGNTQEVPTSLSALLTSDRFQPGMSHRLEVFSQSSNLAAVKAVRNMGRDEIIGITVNCCGRFDNMLASARHRVVSSGAIGCGPQIQNGTLQCCRRRDPQRRAGFRPNAMEKIKSTGVVIAGKSVYTDIFTEEKLPRPCHLANVTAINLPGSIFSAPGVPYADKGLLRGGPIITCIACVRPCEIINANWDVMGPNCGFCRVPSSKSQLLRDTNCNICPIPCCKSIIPTSGPMRRTATCTYIDDTITPPLLVEDATICHLCSVRMNRVLLCNAQNVYIHPRSLLTEIERHLASTVSAAVTSAASRTLRATSGASEFSAMLVKRNLLAAEHTEKFIQYTRNAVATAADESYEFDFVVDM